MPQNRNTRQIATTRRYELPTEPKSRRPLFPVNNVTNRQLWGRFVDLRSLLFSLQERKVFRRGTRKHLLHLLHVKSIGPREQTAE